MLSGKKVQFFFDASATRWSDNYGHTRKMNYRVDQFLNALKSRLRTNDAVLDFGCGTGEVTGSIAAAGFAVTGCDLSSEMIKRANTKYQSAGLNFLALQEDFLPRLPFLSKKFRAIISSSVFEYLPALDEYFLEMKRLLLDDGYLIFTVPNSKHPIRKIEKILFYLNRFCLFSWLFEQAFQITKRRIDFNYLEISINRFSTNEWLRRLAANGFDMEEISATKTPLLLIVAKNRSTL